MYWRLDAYALEEEPIDILQVQKEIEWLAVELTQVENQMAAHLKELILDRRQPNDANKS